MQIKHWKKFIDKECNPKKARFPKKSPETSYRKSISQNAKACRAGFHKKPTKQDGTHMTIYVLRFPSLHRSFQPHTPQSPLPTYHPYSITHTTQHTVTTTHSPSQLHLLYTQNSLNTHHKLLVHIPQLFPYSASSINATAWSHSTPQTLTSTSKQILHYTSTCTIVVGTWKAPCTKLWLLVKIVKQLAGSIKALWHKSPVLWRRDLYPWEDILLPSGTNPIQHWNPWYNYNFTLYSL